MFRVTNRPWWWNVLFGFVVTMLFISAVVVYNKAAAVELEPEPEPSLIASTQFPPGMRHWCVDYGPQRRDLCDRMIRISNNKAQNLRERENSEPGGRWEWNKLTNAEQDQIRRDYKEGWLRQYGNPASLAATEMEAAPNCGDWWVPCFSDFVDGYACYSPYSYANPFQVSDCANRFMNLQNDERMLVGCTAGTLVGTAVTRSWGTLIGGGFPCSILWFNWVTAKDGADF